MIVNGYTEMKPFLPAMEMKGEPNIFDDALDVAQMSLVRQIIGDNLETLLEGRMAADAKLLKLCQRIISQQAFLDSVAELDLVLTDAGFAVVNNEKVTMASRDRVTALTENLKRKIDEGRDTLIAFLLRASEYSEWRGTAEFARLSDALILTFAEFKDVGVLNNVTAKVYPRSWSDFFDLNSAMNVALMTDVAGFISKAYASEIIDRIRAGEPFSPIELKVLKLIKIAVAAYAMGDAETGRRQAMEAVAVMKSSPDDFPTYAESAEFQPVELKHEDTPIFSMI